MSLPLLTGCISQSAAGGGVTAAADLAHWWKMTDGTSTAADFGVDSDGTSALTHHNSPTVVTGPTALGSPDALSFDGSTEYTETLAKNTSGSGGALTAVGATMDIAQWTMTMWMRDRNTGGTTAYGYYQTFWMTTSSGSWNDGTFCYVYPTSLVLAADAYNVRTTGTLPTAWADNTWHLWIYEFDETGGTFSQAIDNGTPVVKTVSFNTALTGATNGVSFALACEDVPRNSPGRYTMIDLSDIRIYKRLLTSGEKAAIYAGDW